LHKQYRPLLHSGKSFHAELADPSGDLRGVVSDDQSTALYVFTQVTTSGTYPPGSVTFPGLDERRRYRVRVIPTPGGQSDSGRGPLPWTENPLSLSGHALRQVGLRIPTLPPENVVLIELRAVE
jgi:alpha-galactosidase